MVKYIISFVILILIFQGCTDKTKNPDKIKILGIRTFFKNKIDFVDEQLYIYKNGDSLVNQYKFNIDGKLDTINSHFYTLDIMDSEDNTVDKTCIINYYSKYRNIKAISREVEFNYLQNISGDKVDYVSVVSSDGKQIKFNYKNYNDGDIEGVINETICLDTIVDGVKSVRVLESVMLVDNKKNSNNKYPLPSKNKYVKLP